MHTSTTSVRAEIARCNTYASDGTLVRERLVPDDLQEKWAGPLFGQFVDIDDAMFYDLLGSPYGNYRNDAEVLRTNHDFLADARLIVPEGSEISGIGPTLEANVFGIAALGNRLLLAWLVDQREIVRVIQPGVGLGGGGQDFWDISYARN
ncbi:hypothetical protein [Nocardioides sp. SYSU DS0663]|uniref:hypothetical protein n=1 Tax=Nocardioides sp. SYSU DS0663 TaxID=3416445 RepID=UPI003F4B3765